MTSPTKTRLGVLLPSRLGFGVQATWPSVYRIPPMMIPIDHCLVSPDVRVVGRRVGPHIGSDHLPVIVELQFP